MTLDQQLTRLGHVGLVVFAAALILLGLWLGARQSREARTRAFWRGLHVLNLAELLATFFRR